MIKTEPNETERATRELNAAEPMMVTISDSDDHDLELVEPVQAIMPTPDEAMKKAKKLMAEGQTPYDTAQQMVQDM
eukprot:10479232-Alexandrium_andersonii.AAC.1